MCLSELEYPAYSDVFNQAGTAIIITGLWNYKWNPKSARNSAMCKKNPLLGDNFANIRDLSHG
jgi:hypothetical protein